MAKKKSKTQAGDSMPARLNVPVVKTILKQQMLSGWGGAAAGRMHEKIKGTQVKQVKGGGSVRVVTSDGKEFPVEASKAVYKYLRSIGEEVVKANPNQNQGGKKAMKATKKKVRTPEEQEANKQKMMEKHQATIEKEGRAMAGQQYIQGEIVQRGGNFMWVKPNSANSIPTSVRGQLQAMNDEFRAKGGEGKKAFLGGLPDNVVYVRLLDISDESLPIKAGTGVKFKLYADSKGVGGCEVVAA